MKITTKKQVRQLIGRKVRYCKKHDSTIYRATIKGVQGQNILIDRFGFTDWLRLPDVAMETIEPTEELL